MTGEEQRDARSTHIPERTCIACRTRRPQVSLLRFSLGDDGTIHFNRGKRLPGRGAWLCPSTACLEQAVRKRAFNRAFRVDLGKVDAKAIGAQASDFWTHPDGGESADATPPGQVAHSRREGHDA